LKALEIATRQVDERRGDGSGTLHLLLGLLGVRGCAAASACRHFGIRHAAVKSRLANGEFQETSRSAGEQWTDETQSVFKTARDWAEQHRRKVITTEYLLLAMMRTKCAARDFVTGLGVDPDEVCTETLQMHGISDFGEGRSR